MRWVLFVVAACLGCGRVAFDGLPDRDAAAAPDGAKSYAATILADHPVGYWRLGETAGLIARDLSGNGFDGSYQGGTTLGLAGALTADPDTSITLDGSTGFVRIPSAPALDSLTVASAEGWVRGGVMNGDQEVWSAWDGPTGYQLIYNSGVAGTWTDSNVVNASITITDNAWHHLVGVWAGAQCFVYVDGAMQGTGPCQATPTSLDNQIGTQCQGMNSTTCDRYRIGDTDEVAVYNYALTAAQVAVHHDAGLGLFP